MGKHKKPGSGSGKGFQNGKQNGPTQQQLKRGKGKKGARDPLKGQWNLVPVGEELFSNKEFENLISFEELTDYDVVMKDDGTKEIRSGTGSTKSRKRQAEEESSGPHEEEEEPLSEPEVAEVELGTKKTKQKAKKKRKREDSVSEVINTSAGPVTVEDDDSVVPEIVLTSFQTENETASKKAKKVLNKKKNSDSKSTSPGKKQTKRVAEEAPKDEDDIEDEFEPQEWVKLGVQDTILAALKENNFNKPTMIQTLTLPAAILGKKDIVGAAETGSGKTLAFAIPIIDGILKCRSKLADASESDESPLKALILTPTRELAVQIKKHFDAAAKHASIRTVVIVGGLASQKQERLLKARPDVVVATPGRLWELVQEGDPHLASLNMLRFLAIDETDRMVERGHFQELQNILEALNGNSEFTGIRQNFVFSATLAFTHEPPERLKTVGDKKHKKQQPKKLSSKDKLKQIMEMVGIRPNPKIVDITTSKGTCETLTEKQISCSRDHKDYYLYYFLICHPGRTIVFCNSINCVRRLTNLFFLLKCGEVLPLHSEMHQKQRLRNLERFAENEKGILIATDVAARGLDIQNIEHVIHFEVPKTAESYIHRSGRTARAFKGGIAVLMIEPGEMTLVKKIFKSLEREGMLPNFDVNGKTFREIKSRVEMAIRVETFEHSVRKKLADHNWMEKAKKEMDLASSEESSDDEGGGSQKKAMVKAKKQLDNYKQQLAKMLSTNIAVSSK